MEKNSKVRECDERRKILKKKQKEDVSFGEEEET